MKTRPTIQWSSTLKLLDYLLEQEYSHNNFDNLLYKRQTALFERKLNNSSNADSTHLQSLKPDYKPSQNVDFSQFNKEHDARMQVFMLQQAINGVSVLASECA